MRLALFFKLFKQDRAAAQTVPPARDAAVEMANREAAVSEAAASDTSIGRAEAAGAAVPLQAANSNSEADPGDAPAPAAVVAPALEADEDAVEQASASPVAAGASEMRHAFTSTAELAPIDGPLGQERAFADISRAAAVAGPGFHLAVVVAPDLLADDAIRAVLADAVPRGPMADWVYVHNFEDASAPRPLRLPAGQAPVFAGAVHEAVGEALARLDAVLRSEERAALRRTIDAETRDALDDRLLAIKTRAEGQNLAVLRTPGGYVVAPVHEGKVVKPDVFARLPDTMRADVETRVRAMQDELAATLAERPAVERERRQRLAAVDEELAREAVTAAFGELSAAFVSDEPVTAHLRDLCSDLVAMQTRRAEGAKGTAPASAADGGHADIPRRMRVNPFLTSAVAETAQTRVVTVQTQASAVALAGHARRVERDSERAADHLDLAPGAAHRAGGGVLYVDAGRLAHFPDGAAALEHMLATSEIVIEAAAPQLQPQPIPLTARVVVAGDRDSLQQLARVAPGLLGRLRSTAHCDDTTERTATSEAALASRMAAAVVRHGLNPLSGDAVAGLVEISASMAGAGGRLSCRLAPLIDVAREADVLARRAGRTTITRADVEAAATARERSLSALSGALATGSGDVATRPRGNGSARL